MRHPDTQKPGKRAPGFAGWLVQDDGYAFFSRPSWLPCSNHPGVRGSTKS